MERLDKMKKDLRVQKTMAAIDRAIVSLLEKKSFERITIQDISNEAMINRGTFYAYYKDKYELIESYQKEMVEAIDHLLYDNIKGENLSDLDEKNLRQVIISFFSYIKENKERVMVIAAGLGTNALSEKFSQHMYNFYSDKSREFDVKFKSKVDEEYLIIYLIHAHMGIMMKWLQDGCVIPVEKMANYIDTFTINGVFKAAGI